MRESNALGHITPTYVAVVAISFLITVCILVNYSFKSTGGIYDQTWNPNSLSNPDSKELVQVLRKASMESRIVIMTIVNEKWASPNSVLDLFLESFKIGKGTKRLLDHLVVATLSSQAFQFCKSVHPHCFQLTTFSPKLAKDKQLGVEDYRMLIRKRNDLLLEVLQLGYSLVFTEADVMWLRSPFEDIHGTKEITIPCDIDSDDAQGGSNTPDSGLFYVKSNEFSIEIFRYWKVEGVLYPNSHVDTLCNEVMINQEFIGMLGGGITFLSTDYYGGFCQPSYNLSEVYTIHGNCCDSIESKVYDLRLVLDDWRKFNALSSSDGLGFFPWRAPSKCNHKSLFI
ncbi:uncharacterized protein At4g15970 [Ziziphus jujuba]|uniref:Uncharacterized protein At4g15970 n=1 Tax=Ziziphus jujuba TaxID=326968 RepID=A0A6P4B5M7_ZIZJJ|nr:uncharacterized protein At4g15970 [Ziziphus jujuba]